MGNQGSASAAFRRGVELIEDGAIGEIKEAYVWCEGGGPDVKEPPQGNAAGPGLSEMGPLAGPQQGPPLPSAMAELERLAGVRHGAERQPRLAQRVHELLRPEDCRVVAGRSVGQAANQGLGRVLRDQPAVVSHAGRSCISRSRPAAACRRSRSTGSMAEAPRRGDRRSKSDWGGGWTGAMRARRSGRITRAGCWWAPRAGSMPRTTMRTWNCCRRTSSREPT